MIYIALLIVALYVLNKIERGDMFPGLTYRKKKKKQTPEEMFPGLTHKDGEDK